MKIVKSLLLTALVCSIKFSIQAQTLFADNKCTILYCGYGNNQVFFTSKIDTTTTKIIGKDCEIIYQADNMILVYFPIQVFVELENKKSPMEINLKLVEKETNKLLTEKIFQLKRLSEYKVYIDESIQNGKLTLTKGLISLKSPDEATTCNLPSLTENITDYEIAIEGNQEIMKGYGTTIQKKQLKALKKYKKKSKADLKMTLTLTVLNVDDKKTPRKKAFEFTY